MSRSINKEGLDLIKQWEGLKLKAYRDVIGKLTIGYGHTSDSGNPPAVTENMEITKKEAESILRRDLRSCEKHVSKLVTVPLTDEQFSALVSFCYNVGGGNFKKSNLLKKLNSGLYEAIPGELQKWNKSGGKIVTGLANRRAAESGLWVKGSFISSNYHEPDHSGEARRFYTEIGAPVVGAVSGLGSMASNSNVMQYSLAAVMICGALIGIYFCCKRAVDNRP